MFVRLILSLVLWSTLVNSQTANCMWSGSIYVDGRCFKLNDTDLTWAQAKSSCEALGGALATITTQNQIDVLITNFNIFNYVWCGANDIQAVGTFVWAEDNSPATQISANNLWGYNNPNTQNGNNCVEINDSDKKLFNDNCDFLNKFVCMETLPTTITSTSTPTTTKTSSTATITSGIIKTSRSTITTTDTSAVSKKSSVLLILISTLATLVFVVKL